MTGSIDLRIGTSLRGQEYILAHDVTAAVVKGLADADLGSSLSQAGVPGVVQGGHIASWSAVTTIYARLE